MRRGFEKYFYFLVIQVPFLKSCLQVVSFVSDTVPAVDLPCRRHLDRGRGRRQRRWRRSGSRGKGDRPSRGSGARFNTIKKHIKNHHIIHNKLPVKIKRSVADFSVVSVSKNTKYCRPPIRWSFSHFSLCPWSFERPFFGFFQTLTTEKSATRKLKKSVVYMRLLFKLDFREVFMCFELRPNCRTSVVSSSFVEASLPRAEMAERTRGSSILSWKGKTFKILIL